MHQEDPSCIFHPAQQSSYLKNEMIFTQQSTENRLLISCELSKCYNKHL